MNHLYAIRDGVAQALTGMAMYMVMCFRTDVQAARYFSDAVNDKSSILNRHPQDYDLIRIGSVDDNGKIDALTTPQVIINGAAVLAVQDKENENNAPAQLLPR